MDGTFTPVFRTEGAIHSGEAQSGLAEDPVHLGTAHGAGALSHAATGLADLDFAFEVALVLALHAVTVVRLGHAVLLWLRRPGSRPLPRTSSPDVPLAPGHFLSGAARWLRAHTTTAERGSRGRATRNPGVASLNSVRLRRITPVTLRLCVPVRRSRPPPAKSITEFCGVFPAGQAISR